ncbi:MAG: glycerol-3-phosphate acyltransferase [Patescibacteria group bacterium]|nr:glycerol-3-phosphate acyltransferase [Patescibacteria group bacterium]MBU1877182.1 glycerol-3-phosphate acyltransferase [Patescibacteria group bacterium]
MNIIFLSVFAYLLGSISLAFLIGKVHKIDIRTIGSKSTSSTNLSRALGWRWGVVSAATDFLKGVIPVLLVQQYLTGYSLILVSLLPMVGHIFPIFLGFKGGKGAATFFGATIVLIGFNFFLFSFLLWIIALILFRITSLTNLIFVWSLTILFFFNFPFYYFIYGLLGALIITLAMRENIKRLIAGTEPKVNFKW